MGLVLLELVLGWILFDDGSLSFERGEVMDSGLDGSTWTLFLYIVRREQGKDCFIEVGTCKTEPMRFV